MVVPAFQRAVSSRGSSLHTVTEESLAVVDVVRHGSSASVKQKEFLYLYCTGRHICTEVTWQIKFKCGQGPRCSGPNTMTSVWSMFGSREMQVLQSFLTLENTGWWTVLFLLASWITTAGYHLLSDVTVWLRPTSPQGGTFLRNTAQISLILFNFIAVNNVLRCFTETWSLKKREKKKNLTERTHHQDPGHMESLVLPMVGQRKKERGRWGRVKQFL